MAERRCKRGRTRLGHCGAWAAINTALSRSTDCALHPEVSAEPTKRFRQKGKMMGFRKITLPQHMEGNKLETGGVGRVLQFRKDVAKTKTKARVEEVGKTETRALFKM